MRSIVTDRVAWCVGLSVTLVSPAKTAEPIEMPFELWAPMGPRNHVFDEVQISHTRRGNFAGKRVAHCKVWGFSAVICAETAEPIDLPFGLWTRVRGPKEAQVQSYSPGDANVPTWESQIFLPKSVFGAPFGGDSLGGDSVGISPRPNSPRLLGRVVCVILRLSVLIKLLTCYERTDRRTDVQTQGHSIYRANIASRGKTRVLLHKVQS